MSTRPRTNQVTLSSSLCCEPVTPLDCSRYEAFMDSATGTKKRFRLEDGQCMKLVAFDVAGEVQIYVVDGGECASNTRIPLVRCGAAVVINPTIRVVVVCGPGWFEADNTNVPGQVLIVTEQLEGSDPGCPTGGADPCTMGAAVPAGTIVALVGVDSTGCLVKQAVETVEFRDCTGVLLFNAYKIV